MPSSSRGEIVESISEYHHFLHGYLRYTETSSNRIFVTVECLYGFKVAIAGGLKRIVKS